MFYCPNCQKRRLEVSATIALPPGEPWDEEALQLISCGQCESAGLAVYRESRRGALDDESVHHEGAFLPLEELLPVRATLLLCPKHDDPRCGCPAHRELRDVSDALMLRKLFDLNR